MLQVASFDDIAIVLAERLGERRYRGACGDESARAPCADDDIESLRDLASGAPVVRAVNDLLEKAVELRASDIHIEPFRGGLTVRMRIDGLLRADPGAAGRAAAGAHLAHQEFLAGLNIAERRLPQDGAARLRLARSESISASPPCRPSTASPP